MHVRRLPSGRWRWAICVDRVRRSGTCNTKAAAINAGRNAELELGTERRSELTDTVDVLLEAWQAERADTWSPTYAADVALVCSRLPHAFVSREVGEVTPIVVAVLMRQLAKEGWSAHRVRRAHDHISSAYKMAILYGWATANPCHDLPGPRVEPAEIHPPNHDMVRALLAAAPERLRLIIRLAAVTGCRLGELCALRWDDIDGDTLSVRRTVVYTPASGLVVRDTTKTGRRGDRRLPLDPNTVTLLNSRLAGDFIKAVNNELPAPVYVFSHDAGITPWRPGYVGLEYRRLRRKVPGGEHVRFHDFRHYVITTMLADGEPLIDAMNQAGHATPTTTGRVYAHFMPGRGRESTDRRAGRLEG